MRAKTLGTSMVGGGCLLALAWVAFVVTLGAWSVQYVVSYWSLYFMHVAKHVPYLPAAIAGFFLSEITFPAAIATWVLSFIL